MSLIRVNWRASVAFVGSVFKWLSVPLSFPLLLAVYYGNR